MNNVNPYTDMDPFSGEESLLWFPLTRIVIFVKVTH